MEAESRMASCPEGDRVGGVEVTGIKMVFITSYCIFKKMLHDLNKTKQNIHFLRLSFEYLSQVSGEQYYCKKGKNCSANKRHNNNITSKDKGPEIDLCFTIINTSHAIMSGQHLSRLWLVVSSNFMIKKNT